jgi:RNA polymerase sigma-70 factor (ECF subfamily)
MPIATGGPDAATAGDAALIAALRSGDEAAFVGLVEQLQGSLVRVAMLSVRDRGIAEEVVQEAWIAVIKGLDRFEGRSSLRTWISRIVTYQARSRGERDRRQIPFSALAGSEAEGDEPAVDADRFHADGRWKRHWSDKPQSWGGDAEAWLLTRETGDVIARTLETLPLAQRTVMNLRDVEGWSSDEVCEALEISPGNQRVLLHRARSKVRAELERYAREARAV